MNLEEARERMVVEQLERRGIRCPRVLAAMREVPRHLFVAPEAIERAYEDSALPIAADQTISQPYMVALMTEVADLKGGERVLEIGTGSGYQTAILARLAASVYSIEYIEQLHRRASEILGSLGITNCYLRCGDGSEGWPEAAPFEVIIVTAAMPGIARPLLRQLATGGRLVAPIGDQELQTLVRISRIDDRWQEEYFGECVFVKMVGKHGFDG
jgi:protein-L-isoaspartate(D-aspartate) O-methyltransferase